MHIGREEAGECLALAQRKAEALGRPLDVQPLAFAVKEEVADGDAAGDGRAHRVSIDSHRR
eukprot:scaffold169360_cov32-Tisochrysis_lutea.AAC.1